jgi:hypothetical protein
MPPLGALDLPRPTRRAARCQPREVVSTYTKGAPVTFNFKDLSPTIRGHMISEITADLGGNKLYISDNLNPAGQKQYAALLLQAATSGSEGTLATALQGHLNTHEKPRVNSKTGVTTQPTMRINAHEMLAEGEFNRFYMRAICIEAIAKNLQTVTVYRAKAVANARSESMARVGTSVSAIDLLKDLRASVGIDTHLGLPPGPNSGLSIHL